jgi:hypothetical protein
VESFDPRIVYWFRKNAPDLMRGQLSESYKGWRATTSPLKAFAMSHFWTNLLTRPNFLAYGSMKQPLALRLARWQKAFLVYWTEEPDSDRDTLEQRYDCIIFEHFYPDQIY